MGIDKTRKKIWLNSCEWGVDDPWKWMKEFANSWRTGQDHHDDWGSTSGVIEHNADLGQYAGKSVCSTQTNTCTHHIHVTYIKLGLL